MMGRVRVTSLVNVISIIRQLLFFSKKRETAPYPPSPQFFFQKNKQKITLFLAPKKTPTNPNPLKSEYETHKKNNTHLFDKFRLMVQFICFGSLLTLEDGFSLVSVMQ